MPEPQIAERASLRYRADIDGLRAVAVVPVVLYHYGVPGFGGGFVGVDVFFVVSGFLITSLIFAEMREGEFSIVGFYERRARRILPALFVMMGASAIAAAAILFPRDLIRFGESAASAAFFGSNFDFWSQAGYFDTGADTKPLLHTWSLAVEEQFYVLFPAVLYLLHTRSRLLLLGFVAALAAISFGLSVWAVQAAPSAAFYLLPFRTWELMLGAVLALAEFPVPRGTLARDAIMAVGLCMIGWSVFVFDADTHFPGAAALVPCLGTAGVLYAGGDKADSVTRALSWRPVVFIGLISYSLYLWHWPFYVFASYLRVDPLPAWEAVALIAASFVLAIVSWRFVERPFRANRHLFTRPRIFALSGAAMVAFLALCGAGFATAGWPSRFRPQVQRLLAEANDVEGRRNDCFNLSADRVAKSDFCTIGDDRVADATFLMWGDSHAEAMLPAVDAAAHQRGLKGLFIARSRCPPLLHIELSDEPTTRCAHLNDIALRVAMRPEIKIVMLVARWAFYDQGVGVGPDTRRTRRLVDLSGDAPRAEDQHARFARMLAATVGALRAADRTVVLVADVPEVSASVPEALARRALAGHGSDIRPALAAYEDRERFVKAAMERLESATVRVVRPADAMCDTALCAVESDGRPLYADNHHLSVFGAERLSHLFVPLLR